jgi:hypothetical protein
VKERNEFNELLSGDDLRGADALVSDHVLLKQFVSQRS